MVLDEDQKRILQGIAALLFVVIQTAVYLSLGETSQVPKEGDKLETIIDKDCLPYIYQVPIQSLPPDYCVRQIKYLSYRINLLVSELNRVDYTGSDNLAPD